jgi:hypothetical protein
MMVALSPPWDGLGRFLMFELKHFDDGLDLLIEWDSKRHYGCLRGVVYDRAAVAQDATRLAVNLNVPLMTARDLPGRPKAATPHVRSGTEQAHTAAVPAGR